MNSQHYDNSKLKELREKQGFGRFEFAKALNINYMTLRRAEDGDGVSYETLADICHWLEIPVTDLIYPYPKDSKNFSAAT